MTDVENLHRNISFNDSLSSSSDDSYIETRKRSGSVEYTNVVNLLNFQLRGVTKNLTHTFSLVSRFSDSRIVVDFVELK